MTTRFRPSRRTLLCGAAAAAASSTGLFTGCTGQSTPSPNVRTVTRGPTPRPDADDLGLVLAVIADEEKLLALCTGVLARHPDTVDLVSPLRRRQRVHVRGLRALLAVQSPDRAESGGEVPRREQVAWAQLVARVRQARDDRFDDCLAAESGPLASHLASMSASHAASAEELAAETDR